MLVKHQGYKIQLFPTEEQKEKINRMMNAKIKAYNWGLETQLSKLNEGKKLLTRKELMGRLRKLMNTPNSGFMWLKEFSTHGYYFAFDDLNNTLHKYLTEKRQGKPKFKSVRDVRKTFSQRNDMKLIKKGKIQLAKVGLIEASRTLNRVPIKDNKKYSGIRFSKEADKYYVSFNVLQEFEPVDTTNEVIGIDLGLRELAVCSNGMVLDNVFKDIAPYRYKLSKLNRKLNRQVKGSKNHKKTKEEIRRVNRRISNIINDRIHKFTSEIIKRRPRAVIMEDLAVSHMMRNRYIAKDLQFAKFRFFRDVMQYKCERTGIDFRLANRFYPSSKICSNCGVKKYKLSPNVKIFKCGSCGLEIDRDVNASINLENYYYTHFCGSTQVKGMDSE